MLQILLLSKQFLLLICVTKVVSDCGQPASNPEIISYGSPSSGQEGQEIQFECNEFLDKFKTNFRLGYWNSRQCVRGKWNRRHPKCASLNDVNITKVLVIYPDLNDTFNNWQKIDFKVTNILRIKFTFEPRIRVSMVYILFETDIDENDLAIDIYINKYRSCIKNPLGGWWGGFVCEANSLEDFNKETNDLPNSFLVNVNSSKLFKFTLEAIKTFQFSKECGRPDLPIHARETNYGEKVEIDPLPRTKYKEIENGTYTINCLYEGNWDKQFSEFEPIIKCSVNDFDFNSSHYQNHSFVNFEFFNGSQVAVIGSTIQYQCTDSTRSQTALCDENGSWRISGRRCEQIEPDNLSGENGSTFIIIALSSILLIMVLVIIFVGLFIWRRNTKKKLKKYLDVKYDDTDNVYATVGQKNDYEDINYEEVGTQPNNYMQLYESLPGHPDTDYVNLSVNQ